MTDLDLARLAAASYAEPATLDHIDWQDLRVCFAEMDGALVVIPRGTLPDDLHNLLRDVEGWPERSKSHPQLGLCHEGFLNGADALFPEVQKRAAGRRVIFTAHSLGAALAILLGAELILAGIEVELLVTWESPRAGGEPVRAIWANRPVRQYRYGDDPITEVPWAPLLYSHVRPPLIPIGVPMLDPIECHSIAGIVTWLETHGGPAAFIPSLVPAVLA